MTEKGPPSRSKATAPSVDPFRHVVTGGLGTAGDALVHERAPYVRASRMQKRFLAFREACWTKPMGWFGTTGLWLQHKGNGPVPDWLKLIVLLLSVPIFEASHFCFKRA